METSACWVGDLHISCRNTAISDIPCSIQYWIRLILFYFSAVGCSYSFYILSYASLIVGLVNCLSCDGLVRCSACWFYYCFPFPLAFAFPFAFSFTILSSCWCENVPSPCFWLKMAIIAPVFRYLANLNNVSVMLYWLLVRLVTMVWSVSSLIKSDSDWLLLSFKLQ